MIIILCLVSPIMVIPKINDYLYNEITYRIPIVTYTKQQCINNVIYGLLNMLASNHRLPSSRILKQSGKFKKKLKKNQFEVI